MQRAILLDCNRSGIDLKWSEGANLYATAKKGLIALGSACNIKLAVMILLFGLRSTSVCNLSIESQDGNHLRALDKGGVHRLVPIDETLTDIIAQAKEWRTETGAQTRALFVNEKGREWNRDRLLRATQNAWEKARGLAER